MKQEFMVYPCTKQGKLLKGFCVTVCDAKGFASTIASWLRFRNMFHINYYCLSSDGGKTSKIIELC